MSRFAPFRNAHQLLFFILTALLAAYSAPSAIIISQYYEGTSNNKWIELYNTSTEAVDLAAGAYRLGVWANQNREAWKSSSAPGNSIPLTGTIPGTSTYTVAHSSAALPVYALPPNLSSGSLTHNGDDSVILYTGNPYAFANVVDAFGLTTNTAQDKSFVRKSNIVIGVNTDFNSADWTEYSLTDVDNAAPGTLQYIGYHSTGGSAPDPVIAVSPSGNFGSLITNTATNIVFTISNNGAASNLVIQTPLSLNAAAFSITAQPGLSTIPPGGSTTFSVQFAPLALTNYTGSIHITNNTATPVTTLSLSGTGVSGYAPPPVGFWYEPFDYPDGDITNVSPYWITVTGVTGLLVESGTLLYPDYPVTGKKLSFGSGSLDARRNFPSTNVLYASFLIQVNKLPTTTNDYVVSFNPPSFGTRFFLSGQSATGSFRCGLSSTAANLSWAPNEHPTGVVHRIVLKFNSITSNLNAWVNPGPTETTPDVSVTPAGAVNAIAFCIRQGANFDNGASHIFFDEIIVGGSWDAVQIPEPFAATAILLTLATLALRRS